MFISLELKFISYEHNFLIAAETFIKKKKESYHKYAKSQQARKKGTTPRGPFPFQHYVREKN